MNIILKIILLNIILLYSLKYNTKLLCLLIILFSFYMLYMYYYLDNIIEGNVSLEEYKMNFVGLLNKNIKTSYKEDLLYNSILDNFTRLLKLMDKSEGRVPSTQMCKGELGEWSECSRECGRGQMTRRFNVLQKSGKNGIKCVYENGQVETKECFDRLCKFHEECQEDHDCLSNYCSRSEKICTYPHMCERDKLQNCNMEQCQELENKYGDYMYDVNQQRCINKFIDLTVKELSVKDEISLEAKSMEQDAKLRDNEKIARDLINDIDQICHISASSTPACNDNDNGSLTCNSLREGNIPCYFDYENSRCVKISENPKFTGEQWRDIRIELDKIQPENNNQNYNTGSAEDFFTCSA